MGLRRSLNREAVASLALPDAVVIGPDQTVAEAISLMQDRGVGCLVVTENGQPTGVLTERDILTKVLARDLPQATPVADVMTRNPEVVDKESSVAEVIRAMHNGGFRHMPVVDSSGCLAGVVSVKRIVEYLVEHFPSAVFNLPPQPDHRQSTREGA